MSAYAASDGTLRFLAMLAVLLGPKPDGLYFFEEIDNGIHPARQWLLLELIEKQTAKNGIQVVTTTHSPDLLTVMNDDTFKNTSVVCRLEEADDAIIRPVAELPTGRGVAQRPKGWAISSAAVGWRTLSPLPRGMTKRWGSEGPHHPRRFRKGPVHSEADF